MSQRVTITVKNGSEQHDLNVPLITTPANIAAAVKWGAVESVIVQGSHSEIDGNDPLYGKVREGDVIIFGSEVSAGWRS
jgi:hypothetical protein